MLVIASDLHLTDGTTGMCIPAGAFELFRERLEDMAYDASQRGDGTYRPIESFDLLLLGDILDPLRSTWWTKDEAGYARPWSKPDDPAFVSKVGKITDEIIKKNDEALGILRRIARGEGISLPPPTRDHQADLRVSRDPRSTQRIPVRVRIHYMIGNHDWYYHLPGAGLDRVRRRIVSAMGLANKTSPFPYVPSESDVINDVLQRHSVFGRHGDFYDPFNYYKGNRDHASISDALCVELFNRISVQIKLELQGKLTEAFFHDLDEMGSVRPELMTPVWISSLLDRYQVPPQYREKINETWHDLVEQFLKLDFLDELDEPLKIDLADKIKAALRISHLFSIDNLSDWALAIKKLEGLLGLIRKDNLGSAEWATREEAYKTQSARFIVYGHTHQYTVCPIRTVQKNGMPFDQVYLNCGTWHPVHDICLADSSRKGFVFYKTMSYLGIYRDDERRCKGFDTWSGTLDI